MAESKNSHGSDDAQTEDVTVYPEFEELKIRAIVNGPWRDLPRVWVHVIKRGKIVTLKIDELKHKETISSEDRKKDCVYTASQVYGSKFEPSKDLEQDLLDSDKKVLHINSDVALTAPLIFQTVGLEIQRCLPERVCPLTCLDFPVELFGNYLGRPGQDNPDRGDGLNVKNGIVRIEGHDEIRFLSESHNKECDRPSQFYNWHDDEVVGFASCSCTYNISHSDAKKAVEDISIPKEVIINVRATEQVDTETKICNENTKLKCEITALQLEVDKLRATVSALKACIDTLTTPRNSKDGARSIV